MNCPDCERPMATDANLRSDDTPRPEDDLSCWRAFHGDQCQRPIDWRARFHAAEAELAEQIDATACERELWQLFADRRWEEVWSRDDALEACQKRISGLLDRISGLLSDHALLVAHYDEARENAPRALTDALSDIARIAGERDQAQRETSLLQATVLGSLAVRTLTPDHIEVLREMRQEAAVQQARVGADEYAPAWAVEESRARVEALGAILGEEPSDA